MLLRNVHRLGVLVGLVLVFLYAVSHYGLSSRAWSTARGGADAGASKLQWPKPDSKPKGSQSQADPKGNSKGNSKSDSKGGAHGKHDDDDGAHGSQWAASSPEDGKSMTPAVLPQDDSQLHQEIFSVSTPDKKFVRIDFGDIKAFNPNILPHPNADDIWVVVAQQVNDGPSVEFKEVHCEAIMWDGALRCRVPPAALPVAPTEGGKCVGDLEYFNLNIGPHDARVLFGPEQPYITFGSNSMFTCFGQFVQNFAGLIGWNGDKPIPDADFRNATEMQRPGSWGKMEKNYFMFWDNQGQKYVHQDVYPARVFTQLRDDGSVGPDLATHANASDTKCVAKYMPRPAPELESIHQATNSLKITMCRKADAGCKPSDDNTFIFTIYQHKTYYNFHSVYEPYVMMFEQKAPFRIHAMSKKPLWISGRERHPATNSSDMFYVTSMSWKSRARRYSGFLDDELFLAFGIEDKKAGAIDVSAAQLLGDLGLCEGL
ncbi:integral membrane protein [Purpureocillium lavendulum]|uniref:Integral membrane protein n=1 Tax=Purpureocillium lavendulum TaxID=1247861 RepID=A0AB34FYT9_9HYPO|nr:integral membrane protein [Purpureocillium lavendulum]